MLDEKKLEDFLNKIYINGIPIRNVYTTKSRKEASQTVDTEDHEVLNVRGFGTIDQLLIKSNSTSFSVQVFLDDELYLDETYTYLHNNQDYLNNVTAMLVGTTYYVILKNMNFQRSAFIKVNTTDSVTFSEILAIYNIREETLLVG